MSWPHLNPPDQPGAEPVVESVHCPLDHLPVHCPALPKADLGHRWSDQIEGLQFDHCDRAKRASTAEEAEQRTHQLIGGGQRCGGSDLSPPGLSLNRGGQLGSRPHLAG